METKHSEMITQEPGHDIILPRLAILRLPSNEDIVQYFPL